tara:strand:- start:1166 stop:1537 length:372 start_codon:yes stop_codon:yes gene_type:complete
MCKIKNLIIIIVVLFFASCEKGWIWTLFEPCDILITCDGGDAILEIWEGNNPSGNPQETFQLYDGYSRQWKDVEVNEYFARLSIGGAILYEEYFCVDDSDQQIDVSVYSSDSGNIFTSYECRW